MSAGDAARLVWALLCSTRGLQVTGWLLVVVCALPGSADPVHTVFAVLLQAGFILRYLRELDAWARETRQPWRPVLAVGVLGASTLIELFAVVLLAKTNPHLLHVYGLVAIPMTGLVTIGWARWALRVLREREE